MKIAVCVKRVPDTETRIRVDASGSSIDPSGVKFVVSPYDEFAVEAALRLCEANGSGEVITLSLGEDAAQDILRTTLAMGADRAVLLRGEVTPDGLATAQALAAELKALDAPLVLLGVKAADDDQQQVGPMVATLLGRPCATSVSSFEIAGDRIRCRREVEGGTEVVELPLPAVVTITKGPYEPRYPSLKGIMAAKKKPLEVKDAVATTPRIRVEVLELPAERNAGRFIGQGADAVPELVRRLREEANVL